MSSETSIDFRGIISGARNDGEYNKIVQVIPYAQLIGMELFDMSTLAGKLQPIFLMPKNDHNIGNPTLPAIHGGVVGGFMEKIGRAHV